MHMVDEIEDDQGILWRCYLTFVMISCSVFDLWKCQSVLGEGKTISQHLCDKMLYVGQIIGCQKILISMQSTAQKKISRS